MDRISSVSHEPAESSSGTAVLEEVDPIEEFQQIIRESADKYDVIDTAKKMARRALERAKLIHRRDPDDSETLLIDHLIDISIARSIGNRRHDVRDAIRRQAIRENVRPNPRSLEALRATQSDDDKWEILEHWKSGDKRLGDMTRDDLLNAAAELRATASGLIQRAEFYEAVAKRLKTGKEVVKARLKPEEVEAILAKLVSGG